MTYRDPVGSAAATYAEQDILTEGANALIVRVYDMAVQELGRARGALAARDWAAKGQAVGRASRCISLLQCSLNVEQGGEVAHNLDRIYFYLMARLSEAHLNNDDGLFEEVAGHLAELGSAWRELLSRNQAPAANEAAAAVAAGGGSR